MDQRARIEADQRRYLAEVDRLRSRLDRPVAGVFGPDSVAWRLFREVGLLAAGPRAILLQIAHPKVACGVDEHSRFRDDPMGRARATYTNLYQLVFGTTETALASTRRLFHIHTHVHGTTRAGTSSRHEGEPYRATDPELLRWVWATLVDSSIQVYGDLVRPPTPAEVAEYYVESRIAAVLLGVPDAEVPGDYPAFRTWLDGALAGDDLAVGSRAREMAAVLLGHPTNPDRALTAGWLPPRFRAAYQLPWTRTVRARHRAWRRALRAAIRATPRYPRYAAAYHQALLRIARADGRRGPWVARALRRVESRLPLPFGLVPTARRA